VSPSKAAHEAVGVEESACSYAVFKRVRPLGKREVDREDPEGRRLARRNSSKGSDTLYATPSTECA